jgi:hypothetical protein
MRVSASTAESSTGTPEGALRSGADDRRDDVYLVRGQDRDEAATLLAAGRMRMSFGWPASGGRGIPANAHTDRQPSGARRPASADLEVPCA